MGFIMKKYLIIAIVAALGACSNNTTTDDTSGGDTNDADNVNTGDTGETEALLDILATSFGIRITSAGDGRIELNRDAG